MPFAPAPTQVIKIHEIEVKQTQLQGKWYTPVDGRVKIAEQADPKLIRREGSGYHVVEATIIPIGDRWAYHCMVEYPIGSGVIKPGSDFIDMKDNAGLAKAETSAIGRALGLHGIAVEESIASLEEMANVSGIAQETNEGERVVDVPQEQPARTTQPASPTRQAVQGKTTTTATTQPRRRSTSEQWEHICHLSDYLEIPRKEPTYFDEAATYIKELDAKRAEKRQAEAQQKPKAVTAKEQKDEDMANDRQMTSIRMLCAKLGRQAPAEVLTFKAARDLLTQLSRAYSETRQSA